MITVLDRQAIASEKRFLSKSDAERLKETYARCIHIRGRYTRELMETFNQFIDLLTVTSKQTSKKGKEVSKKPEDENKEAN